MSYADIPPDRRHLAAMLRVFARSGAYFGHHTRHDLHEYIQIAEDTIAAQATALAIDTEVIERLQTQITSLRQLAEAALTAAQLDDGGEGLNIIRQALEKTT